jgi:hypothetical protein
VSRCGLVIFSNACRPNLNIDRSPTLGRPPYHRFKNNTGGLRTGSKNSPARPFPAGNRVVPRQMRDQFRGDGRPINKDGKSAFWSVSERVRTTPRERPRRSRAECTSDSGRKSNQNGQGLRAIKSASWLVWKFTWIRWAKRPLPKFRPKHCNMLMRTHVFLTKISLHTNFFV